MVTINVPNLPPAPATKLDLTEKGFTFHAKVGDKAKGIAEREYAFQLDVFDEIDPKVRFNFLFSCLYVHMLTFLAFI